MTSFCAESRPMGLGAAALLAAMVVLGPAALGQQAPGQATGAPVPLGPPKRLAPEGPSGGTGTVQPAYPAGSPATVTPLSQAAPAPQPADRPLKGGISVDTLGEIDSNTVGALDAGSRGLGIDMWKGTKASLVDSLLPRLERLSPLPTARGLAQRLLLTAARPPAGPWPKDRPSLLARRLGRLLAFGDVGSAATLLRVVPARVEEAAVARARMNTAFLTFDKSAACSEARAAGGRYPGDVWRKALVFCQYLAGEGSKAEISTALLREQGVKDDAFFSLARKLGGDKEAAFTVPARLTPLHLAMMRAAGVQISETLVDTAEPGVIRAIALSPNAALNTRLEAAERAEGAGVLQAERLRQIYAGVTFTPGDLQEALGNAAKLSGPRGRALLYQAARNESRPAERAGLLAKAFVLARSEGRLATATRAFEPLLEEITPTPDLYWFAAEAARALYYTGGAPVNAARWAELAFARPYVPGTGAGKGAAQASSDVAVWPFVAIARVPLAPRPTPPAAEAQAQPARGAAPGAAPGADEPPDFSEVGAGSVSVDAPGGSPSGPPTAAEALAGVRRVEPPAVVEVITTRPDAVTRKPLVAKTAPQAAPPFEDAMFERWYKVQTGVAGEARAQRRAVMLLGILDALGVAVPQAAWVETAGSVREMAPLPPSGLIQALDNAAAGGRLAETVLLALTVLGPDGPEKLHPSIVGAVVRALIKVGLAPEGRALALEVAFGAGL